MANSLVKFKSWGSVARMKLHNRLEQRELLFNTTSFLSLFHGSVNFSICLSDLDYNHV
jgi:hypothetical protein